MTTKSNGKPAFPFEVSSEGIEKFTDAISKAAVRGQAIVETGLENWESEIERYYKEFAAHNRETLDALAQCKGPVDVLGVEQKWFKARAQAYLDFGMRFAKAFAEIARTIPSELAAAKSAAQEPAPKA